MALIARRVIIGAWMRREKSVLKSTRWVTMFVDVMCAIAKLQNLIRLQKAFGVLMDLTRGHFVLNNADMQGGIKQQFPSEINFSQLESL